MEFVVANAGKTRRETYNGRSYIVAPVTMIVPGVLNGSQGALYYPPDEVTKDVGIWNGVPLTNGHPFDQSGNNVSARSPKILDQFQIGYVFNDRVERGNRLADGYFDEEWTKVRAPEIYKAVTNGSRMELSTGLYTNNVPVDNGRSPKGDAYQFVARDYRPDHLAILPNQRGACSLNDGCGLNVNANPEGCNQYKECGGGSADKPQSRAERGRAASQSAHDATRKAFKENTHEAHDAAAKAHSSLAFHPDIGQTARGNHIGQSEKHAKLAKYYKGKKPTGNAAPNQPKSLNTGKYKRNGAGVGKGAPHQSAQDGYHGGPKPCECGGTCEKCKAETTTNSKPKRVKMTRDDNIKWLTTNCECHKNKGSVLANEENYSDAELDALVKNEQSGKAAILVVNGLAKVLPEIGTMAINEIPAFVEGKMKKDDEEEVPVEEETEETEEEEVVENSKRGAGRMTSQQWLDSAPAEIRELVGNAMRREREDKSKVVAKIVANARPADKDRLTKKYMTMTLNDLNDIASLLPKPVARPRQIVQDAAKPMYLGSFTPTINESTQDEADLLVAPTINWAENAKRK